MSEPATGISLSAAMSAAGLPILADLAAALLAEREEGSKEASHGFETLMIALDELIVDARGELVLTSEPGRRIVVSAAPETSAYDGVPQASDDER